MIFSRPMFAAFVAVTRAMKQKPMTPKQRTINRGIRAHALEKAFLDKAVTFLPRKDCTQFKRKWVPGADFDVSLEEKRRRIRVVQYNVLAHGLSGLGGGFGSYQRDEAPIQTLATGKDGGKMKKDEFATYNHDPEYREFFFSRTKSNDKDLKIPSVTVPETYYDMLKGTQTTVQAMPFPARMKRIAGQILAQSPDVITLQEIDRYVPMMKILEKHGYAGEIQYKPTKEREDKDGKVTGGSCAAASENVKDGMGIPDAVAIIWNTDRLKKTSAVLPRGTFLAGGKASKQIYMFIELEDLVTKQSFIVGTGHHKSGKVSKDVGAKKEQLDFIKKIVDGFQQAGRTVIYGCDLNTPTNSQSYIDVALDKTITSAYKHDPKNRRVSAAKLRKSGDQLEKVGVLDKQTIDFIFHSPKVKCVQTLQLPLFKTVNDATGGRGEDVFTNNDCPLDDNKNVLAIWGKNKKNKDAWLECSDIALKLQLGFNPVANGNEFKHDGKKYMWMTELELANQTFSPKMQLRDQPLLRKATAESKLGSLLPCPKQPSDHFLLCADLVLA